MGTQRKKPRRFKCIGLEENKVSVWSYDFTIGKIYYLASIKKAKRYGFDYNENNEVLCLNGNTVYDRPVFVDRDQFVEVK